MKHYQIIHIFIKVFTYLMIASYEFKKKKKRVSLIFVFLFFFTGITE